MNADLRFEGRKLAQETIGQIRTIAANAKRQDPSIDEEAIFIEYCRQFIKGFDRGACSVLGIERLDEWRHNKN